MQEILDFFSRRKAMFLFTLYHNDEDWNGENQDGLVFFSRVHATLQPALSVGRLVGWLVGHVILLKMAPAHPHTTSVAVLLFQRSLNGDRVCWLVG